MESTLFDITNQTTGTVFSARPDESILEAGLRQGHVLPYSCRDGACGSCRATLVSGEFDYVPTEPQALTEVDKRTNRVLLCQARARSNLVIEAREAIRAAGMTIKTLPCRVKNMQLLSHDVMEVTLSLPRVQSLEYLPGQYIDIILRDGRRRSFSIANAPAPDAPLTLHIRKVDGGRFSTHVFDGMKAGDLLRFEGPLGTFYLNDEADSTTPAIFLAGGTGFAPIKAIIEQALETETFSKRQVTLHWGARTRDDLYQFDAANDWADRYPNFTFVPVLSDKPGPGWGGATGFVHESVLNAHPELSAFEVYASGPPAMIQAAQATFFDAGLSEDRFFFDSFEYAVD